MGFGDLMFQSELTRIDVGNLLPQHTNNGFVELSLSPLEDSYVKTNQNLGMRTEVKLKTKSKFNTLDNLLVKSGSQEGLGHRFSQ